MPEPMTPVMTVLEARIPEAKWSQFRAAFDAAEQKPKQMLYGFIVQSGAEPELWRLVSVWRSRAALSEYRNSVKTPGGIGFFRAVGVEPALGMFDVHGVI